MIMLDVDGLPDAAAAERMRDVFAADSCSGRVRQSGRAGVQGRCADDVPADDAEHKTAFGALAGYWKGRGIALSPGRKDAARLCYVSHDPQAFIRQSAAAAFKWRS